MLVEFPTSFADTVEGELLMVDPDTGMAFIRVGDEIYTGPKTLLVSSDEPVFGDHHNRVRAIKEAVHTFDWGLSRKLIESRAALCRLAPQRPIHHGDLHSLVSHHTCCQKLDWESLSGQLGRYPLDHVLCIGSGYGQEAYLLSALLPDAQSVTGIDLSPRCIGHARRGHYKLDSSADDGLPPGAARVLGVAVEAGKEVALQSSRVRFEKGTIFRYQPVKKADLLVAFDLFWQWELESVERFIHRIGDWLRPGGLLLCGHWEAPLCHPQMHRLGMGLYRWHPGPRAVGG